MTATTTTSPRLSPLHDAVAHLHPTWGTLAGMPVALNFGDPAGEAQQAAVLGLCDVSALPRITLKGPGAKAALEQCHVTVPEAIFAVASAGAGGLSARTGGAEFFVEDGPSDTAVARIRKYLEPSPLGRGQGEGERGASHARANSNQAEESSREGSTHEVPPHPSPLPRGEVVRGVYPVNRADASILLSGSQALDILEQTCGVNLRSPEAGKLVYTRVAGVACSILPRKLNNISAFQLWMDGTYGFYLWETLIEIAGDSAKPQAARSAAVGVSCFFPNHSST